jgi:hypothetical protein
MSRSSHPRFDLPNSIWWTWYDHNISIMVTSSKSDICWPWSKAGYQTGRTWQMKEILPVNDYYKVCVCNVNPVAEMKTKLNWDAYLNSAFVLITYYCYKANQESSRWKNHLDKQLWD